MPVTRELSTSDFQLSHLEQAAVLMMSLNRQAAINILRQLRPREVQRLSRAMSTIRQIHRRHLKLALTAFFADVSESTGLGLDTDREVHELLVESLGEERADALFDRINLQGDTRGLDSLRWMESSNIADFISHEHPQIQAIVVAYLEAEHAAEVMELLPMEQKREIAMRISNLDAVQPLALDELNQLIEKQFSGSSAQPAQAVAGRKVLASVLKNIDSVQVDQLLEGVRGEDQQLASQLESMMFVFDDLAQLSVDDLKLLLKTLSPEVLAQALCGSQVDLRRKLLSGLPRKSLQKVRKQLEKVSAISQREVDLAREEVVSVARKMAASGDIVIDTRKLSVAS